MLGLLDAAADPEDAGWYTEVLATLGPEPSDLARACSRILDLLDAASDPGNAARLAEDLNGLGPGPGDLARARGRMLGLLDAAADPEDAGWYTEVLATLGPEPSDLARACSRIWTCWTPHPIPGMPLAWRRISTALGRDLVTLPGPVAGSWTC